MDFSGETGSRTERLAGGGRIIPFRKLPRKVRCGRGLWNGKKRAVTFATALSDVPFRLLPASLGLLTFRPLEETAVLEHDVAIEIASGTTGVGA